jgi:putative endonuclease
VYLEDSMAEALRSNLWHILGQRVRCPYGEVDIIARHPSGFYLVLEVKSISHRNYIVTRLTLSQKRRLARAYLYYQGLFKDNVFFYLAMIETNGEVLWFDAQILS